MRQRYRDRSPVRARPLAASTTELPLTPDWCLLIRAAQADVAVVLLNGTRRLPKTLYPARCLAGAVLVRAGEEFRGCGDAVLLSARVHVDCYERF